MGDLNSKPEYAYEDRQEQRNSSGRHEPTSSYSSNNAQMYSKEELIRGLINENRIKNEKIEMERHKRETEARARLKAQEQMERIIREKERELKEQSEVIKRQNDLLMKQQEIAKQAVARDMMAKKRLAEQETLEDVERALQDKEKHIKEQNAIIKKQNELLENRKSIEKQLLDNLVHTELNKLKRSVKQNPKPFTHNYNSGAAPRSRRYKAPVPDLNDLKIDDECRNKTKQHNFDGRKYHTKDDKRSNSKRDGNINTSLQYQRPDHVESNSQKLHSKEMNDKILSNQHTAPTIVQNHFFQPPPPYTLLPIQIFNAPAVNYPPIVSLPPSVVQEFPVSETLSVMPPSGLHQKNHSKQWLQNYNQKSESRNRNKTQKQNHRVDMKTSQQSKSGKNSKDNIKIIKNFEKSDGIHPKNLNNHSQKSNNLNGELESFPH